TAAPGGGNGEPAPVPPRAVLAPDAGQRRLWRERNQDRLREVLPEGRRPAWLALLVLPAAVEAQPTRALELRTRVFGEWGGRQHPPQEQRRQLGGEAQLLPRNRVWQAGRELQPVPEEGSPGGDRRSARVEQLGDRRTEARIHRYHR